ncbi:MAG: acetate kinase [Bacillota bacterium]|nr:acetate kinase [Bacillota bacterium]
MKVLVVNCGSSSLKYQLIDMTNEEVLAKGLAERIGMDNSRVKHEVTGKEKQVIEKALPDHTVAIETVLGAITDPEIGVIASMDEISAVGHRVVHGGEKFAESVVITDEVIKAIEDCIDLAPLHNPANLMGIAAIQKALPDTPNVAVFDTAFHQTMPPENYLYALPYELYEQYGIRKYGFHGTSHKYVAERAAEMLGKPLEECNIITCHLGNGASICAIKNGQSYDTSMGFTPLDGLVMGTRSGLLDPSITLFLMNNADMTVEEVDTLYNKKSGVLGVSGVSSDFRDIEEAADNGNERARLALDLFVNRVQFYLGGYTALLEEVDAIVFTAGLGENSPRARNRICEGLQCLAIELDEALDTGLRGKEALISKAQKDVKVFVIPTDEELMIARDTVALTK